MHYLHVNIYKLYSLCASNPLSNQVNLDTLKKILQQVLISSLCISKSSRLVEPFLSRQVTIICLFAHCAPRICNKLSYRLGTINDSSTFIGRDENHTFLKKTSGMKNLLLKSDYKV